MPRNKTTRQLLAAVSLGVVVALVVLLSTCAAAPTQSPVNPKAETTSSVDPPQESTRTVESSASATEEHNPTDASCIVCHLRPSSHGIDPFTCAECHSYPDWSTATHPSNTDCRSCHSKPSGHPSTGSQCSTCHKSAGVNWAFQHPGSSDCADCHTAPKGHYGTNCDTCHSPSVPFADTQFKHTAGMDCTDCHKRPHRSYPADCATCHRSVGVSWKFSHPKSSSCRSCHTAPAGHFGTNCATCHTSSKPWLAAQLVHDGGTSDCASCHTPPHRADYPVTCSSCHPKAGVAWMPPIHTADTRCASCHTAPVPHYGTQCSSCHNPSVPFADGQIVHGPGTTACQDCHTRPHQAYPVACNTCHTQAGVTWAATHPATTSDCASCHTPPHRTDYPVACTSCHPQVGVAWRPPVHADSTACASCHTAPVTHYGTNCDACHSPSVPFADATIAHGPATTACQDCHTPPHSTTAPFAAACNTCHTQPGVAWTFTHPAAADCASCHTPPHRADYPVTCTNCHPQVGVAWVPPVHTDSTACASCHAAPAAHYGTNCAACHDPSAPFAAATIAHGPGTTACEDCHTPPHTTTAPFAAACNACHTQPGVVWTFAHPAADADCASCHPSATVEAHSLTGCDACHDHSYATVGHGAQIPTPAGCGSTPGGGSNDCHNLVHYYDTSMGTWGSGPFSCTDCHSPSNPNVPQLGPAPAGLPSMNALTAMTATQSPLTQPTVTETAGIYQLDWSGGTMPYTVLVDEIVTATVGAPAFTFSPDYGEYSIIVSDASGARTDPIAIVRSAEVSYTPPAARSLNGYIDYAVPDADPAYSEEATASVPPTKTVTAPPIADSPDSGPAQDKPAADGETKSDSDDVAVPVDAPRNFKARIDGLTAALSWTAESGMHYEVQQADNSSFAGTSRAWTGTGGRTELGAFSAGDEVWLRIRARTSDDGEPGPWSDAEHVQFPAEDKAPAPPEAPDDEAKNPEDDPTLEIVTPAPSVPDEPTVDSQPPADPPAAERPAEAAPAEETAE